MYKRAFFIKFVEVNFYTGIQICIRNTDQDSSDPDFPVFLKHIFIIFLLATVLNFLFDLYEEILQVPGDASRTNTIKNSPPLNIPLPPHFSLFLWVLFIIVFLNQDPQHFNSGKMSQSKREPFQFNA